MSSLRVIYDDNKWDKPRRLVPFWGPGSSLPGGVEFAQQLAGGVLDGQARIAIHHDEAARCTAELVDVVAMFFHMIADLRVVREDRDDVRRVDRDEVVDRNRGRWDIIGLSGFSHSGLELLVRTVGE